MTRSEAATNDDHREGAVSQLPSLLRGRSLGHSLLLCAALSIPAPPLSGQGAAGDQEGSSVSVLAQYDFDEHSSRDRLSRALREISGLAVVDGRVFAHNDEQGRIYELDPGSGDVLAEGRLGPDRVSGDFEGIAFIPEGLAMITSRGTLVEIPWDMETEWDDMEDGLTFRTTRTGLADTCEIEGLAEASGNSTLLIVCKTNLERRLWGTLQVFAFDLETRTLREQPHLQVGLDALEEVGLDQIHPSGIAEHPDGHLLILTSQERGILEIDAAGVPIAWVKLDKDRHRQPEGIAFLPNGDLLIADEGDGGRARLTTYATDDRP